MEFQQIRGATSIVTFGGLRFLIDPFFAPKGSTPPIPSPYNDFPRFPCRWKRWCAWTPPS